MEKILKIIIQNPALHARWLNTLSFLENCGARMLARAEHPTLVKEEMLKHAAEEFRHALHFKKQIGKIGSSLLENYSLPNLLGGYATLHYLRRLETLLCRAFGKEHAYLLVTYGIEKRAQKLYPLYHRLLKEAGSRVAIKSVLLEEEEHLEEISGEIATLPDQETLKKKTIEIEETLFFNWRAKLYSEV